MACDDYSKNFNVCLLLAVIEIPREVLFFFSKYVMKRGGRRVLHLPFYFFHVFLLKKWCTSKWDR